MTPIERIRRRAEAASRLNVSIYSSAETLRSEWQRQAFETHPDRNGGDDRAFRELQRAYEILVETAPDQDPPRRTWRSDTGPTVSPRRVVSRTSSRTPRPKD